jgi:hypothetical protein
MSAARKPELSEIHRARIEAARKLVTAEPGDLSADYDAIDPANAAMVNGFAFGMARATVRELLGIIGDLTGGAQ